MLYIVRVWTNVNAMCPPFLVSYRRVLLLWKSPVIAYSSLCPPIPANIKHFHCLSSFASSRKSYSWNHLTVTWNLWRRDQVICLRSKWQGTISKPNFHCSFHYFWVFKSFNRHRIMHLVDKNCVLRA